jgi:cytochrome oxidase Cu insertion factor (SCO1/SenC/PrrC family)
VGAPLSPARRARALRAGVTTLAALAAIGLALLARALRPAPPLPVLGHLPDFALLDQRGAEFRTSAMLGHVSVVDFIFTHCTSSCPRLTAMMGELQGRLERERSAARLVSFSVDPENDLPPVLAAYGSRAHADPARWSFVTGPPDDVERAIIFGFKVSAAKIARGANDYDVTHGDWLVLVDANADLRGYYAMSDPGEADRLMQDVLRLERHGGT